jgi:ferredoxin--NADP+ reductase
MKDSRYCQIELVDRINFSDDLALFRFQTDERLDFTPGQYATLGVHPDDMKRPLLRAYSIASAPHEDTLDFFIELVDEGQLTPRLFAASTGDRLWMRKKIVGRFTLDTACHQHVLAATVTGVAPYVSIMRDQIQAVEAGRLDMPHDMLIIHGASHSWELGTYLRELRAADDRYDWLTYVPTVSRPWDETDWSGEVGRVEDVLRKHADAVEFHRETTAAYTCGHPQMIDKAQAILERAGYAPDHVHEEKYWVEKREPVA